MRDTLFELLSLCLTFNTGVKLCPEEGYVDEKGINVMGGNRGKY